MAPDVSVVIPTHDRETRLAFALEALAEQTVARERFEVIVVRSPGGASGPLTEAPPGLEVTFLRSEVGGPAAQRNLGWRNASGRLIAFTDDDCRPEPDWLKQMLAAEAGPETFLQGRTVPDPEEGHLLHGFARTMDVDFFDAWAPTCNIVYPRAVLERIDGFDESFANAWGEDTDMAQRAIETGVEQHFVEHAVVRHAVLPRRLSQALGDAARRSDIHIVVARHPRLRGALDLGLFTKRRHAYILLALAALPFARRRPWLAFLALVPYLRFYNPGPPWSPGRVVWWLGVFMPRRLLLDLTVVGAMARSSIKYKTPVL